ncbi:MAG: hypothetical protein ACAH88_14310 [Roseimicrobium sp.]
MSRRTKYIIAALFLVLLTVPVVYLFLTWSPERPLRFRLLTPQPKLGEIWTQRCTFEIENTSAVSIYLLKAGWEEVSDPGMQDTYYGSLLNVSHPGLTGPGFYGSQALELAPHSTVRVESDMGFDPFGGPEVERAMIHHSWVSHPKYVACAMLDDLFTQLPKSLQRFHPTPKLNEDIIPLEPAP